ncbi:MAG: DMT family protein [bacterium]|nr:DMT family protein [bacterium]
MSFAPVALLFCSNLFMTYAWYGHLRDMKSWPLWMVILASWGIAFFEYSLQVPANRMGAQTYSLAQLKVMQEIIALIVFGGFSWLYFKEEWSWDYLWAGCCLLGAAYFMFRHFSMPT